MNTSTTGSRAKAIETRGDKLIVRLDDGREVSVPLSWFPRLAGASPSELRNWSLIGAGEGIHWPELDEHVSVESLLRPERTTPSREIREAESKADHGA